MPMTLEDLLSGLLGRSNEPDPRVLGEALLKRQMLTDGIAGHQPMRAGMEQSLGISDSFPNRGARPPNRDPNDFRGAEELTEGQADPTAFGAAPRDVLRLIGDLGKDQSRAPSGGGVMSGGFDPATARPVQTEAAGPGGMFGGLPGWAPDERPIAMGAAPPQPTAYAPQPDPTAGMPPQMRKPPPGGGGGMPPPGGPPGAPPNGGQGGGLLSGLGVSPDMVSRFLRSFGSGLKSIRNSPFAGEAFGSGAGGALEGGAKFDELDANRALKERGQDQTADYRNRSLDIQQQNADSLADSRFNRAERDAEKVVIQRKDKESLSDYRTRVLDLRNRGVDAKMDADSEKADIAREKNSIARDKNDLTGENNTERNSIRRDTNDIRREGNAIKRRAGESLEDFRDRKLQAEKEKPARWNKPPAQLELDYERAVRDKEKNLQASPRFANPPGTPRAVAEQRQKALQDELDAYKGNLRDRMNLPITPGAGRSKAPADATTAPVTPDEYQSLKPGQLYKHPDDVDQPLKFRRKPGKPAVPTSQAPAEDDGPA